MHYIVKVPSNEDLAYCFSSPSAKGQKILWDSEGRLISFRMGVKIDEKLPTLLVTTDKDHGSDFQDVIPNNSKNLIVSQRFIDTIDAVGVKNIQLFPIKIKDFKSKKDRDYIVCNVVGLISCLDRKASDISYEKKNPNEIFMLKKLCLDEAAIEKGAKGMKIFRLEESPDYLIVSEEIKNAIEAAKLTGIEFKKSGEAGDFL